MSGWISVKDMLPEKRGLMLVNVNGGGVRCDRFMPTGKFYRYDGYVTHWMPLPEPPKEQER